MAVIYKFQNLVTNEVYIGSSELPETRRQQYEKFYRSSLSRPVIESIERDGIDNHRWIVIVDIPHSITAVQLHKLEEAFIIGYHSAGFQMLNIDRLKKKPPYRLRHERMKGKTVGRPKKLTSEKSKSLYASKRIPIVQLDGDGNVVREWPSIKDCWMDLNISSTLLYHRLRKGGEFRRKTNDRKTPVHKHSFINRPVYQLNFHDEVINEFPSLTVAAEKTNINLYNISSVCRGRLKTAGGFRWKYKKDDNGK